ncbi:MAG: carboxypeptidase regulatory-like domain-containing protein, partial [Blastocatellia bacterium]
TAQNIATGVVSTATSNEAGIYLFPNLQPGAYRVAAEKNGFRKTVYNDVTLELSARVTVDFELQVGQLAEEAVQISASFDTRLAIGTNSVGGVITGQKVQDLPLPGRNALDLVYTQGGLVGDNFAGARIGTLNISRDGVNVQDQRINVGVASTIFTSVDLIQEVRVVTSPADAEFGRGSGQIQMITRSGTNEFHGSVFEAHRNTVLNANTWFNNQRGRDPITGDEISPRNGLIRNQFGGRLGGPIWKNKSFFHVLYEGQLIATNNSITSTVYTATARQGIFRFFPGVQNGNVNAVTPTVDLLGNPIKPAQATGELQTINLLTRDPNRKGVDNTGYIQKMLALVPLPNNFRAGDGLNTAGYTWRRKGTSDFNHVSLKLDHTINQKNQLAFSFTHEQGKAINGFVAQNFPNSPGGTSESYDFLYSISLNSTLRPDLVNEFRYGALRPRLRFRAPWEVAGFDLFPKAGSVPYVIDFLSITDPINHENDPQGRISPSYQFADNIVWQRGRHAFKGGVEMRFVSTNGFNSFTVLPRANIGSGNVAVQNVANIAGIGQNSTPAVNLLNELSGSLGSVSQAFNAPAGPNPVFLLGEGKQRTWQQREFSWFFKDDFKVRPNLTLNLGVRYEFYGVPYEANGKAAGLVGGSNSIFGITGTSIADLFQPGLRKGDLTKIQLVGKNSPNEKTRLYDNDLNNFAPAAGFSWSIPYFGKDKTVLRVGYGIGYERNSLRLLDVVSGDQPGLRTVTNATLPTYFDLTSARLPLVPVGAPLETVPFTDRTQTVRTYDDNLRTPYVQNWNITLQRELFRDGLLEVRYVGNKGTKLIRGFDINEVNIFNTGILDAFLAVQAGGTHPLVENMFRGLNLGLGAINGAAVTAGASLRTNANTRGFFAQGDVGGFAGYLATTTNFTGVRGDLLRRANLPENFLSANPQFASARLTSNVANSSYHSLQLDFTKRFSGGWVLQSNYTWSKALGEEEGAGQEMVDSYRTLRNLGLEKRRLSFDFTHVWRTSGTYEAPFGPGRKFLKGNNHFVSRLVERWQFGFISNLFSGQPISLAAARSSFNQFTDNTPALVGKLSKGFGTAKVTDNGVVYFNGLQQATDPAVATITTQQGLQDRSTLRAITDASGNLILINPVPGQLGTLAPMYLEGPGSFRLDVNLIKRFRIRERSNFELRADLIDVLNTPQWGNPNTDINSLNFGRITDAGGNRIIVIGARINF